jgi:hypothetical protein
LKRESRRGVKKMAPLLASSPVLAQNLLIYHSINLGYLRTRRVTTPGFNVSVCGRFNLAQLAEGESGEGTSRVCSVLRAFVKIRLEKSVLEKTLRVRASSQKKFPRRALNLRNVVHVRSELSHVRSKMP